MKNQLLRPVRFPAIDGIRFYAALAVFVEHILGGAVTEYFRIPAGQYGYHVGPWWQRFVFYVADGNHGVDVFFIISGFLMSRIVLADERQFDYLRFILNRVKRIYPAFLMSLIVTAAAACLLFGWPWKPLDFAKNLVFLNAIPGYAVIPYNHVSWSLGFEFAFYLIIPALLLATRFVDRRIAAALVLVVAFVWLPVGYIRMNALFVGAMIGAFGDNELKAIANRLPLLLVALSYMALGILKAVYFQSYSGYYYWFLPTATLLFIKVVWGHGILTRFFSAQPMRKLGTLSYSIYLWHSIAASVVLIYLTPKAASLAGAAWYIALTAAITLCLAWLSYQFIERRYFDKSKHHMTGSQTNQTGQSGCIALVGRNANVSND